MSASVSPQSADVGLIARSLRAGWADFRAMPLASMGFSAGFVLIGLALIWLLLELRLAPLVPPLIGAFMIIGPVALCGFMALREARHVRRRPTPGLAYGALRHAPRGVWVLGGFCMFMTLVWLTDASTLYSFMIGRWQGAWQAVVPQDARALRFHAGSGLVGGVLALIVFTVTVHGVPLAIRGDRALVPAVAASVRAVGHSLLAHLTWAALLSGIVLAAVVLLPALLVALPVAAYASLHWSEGVYPPAPNDGA